MNKRELIALKQFCKAQGIPEEKTRNMNLKELEQFMVSEGLLFICGGK